MGILVTMQLTTLSKATLEELAKHVLDTSVIVFVTRLCHVQGREPSCIVVMRTVPCPLEQRPEALNRVRMRLTANVLDAMIDNLVWHY